MKYSRWSWYLRFAVAGVSLAALRETMEPYLTILRAFALAEGATNPARREQLIQRVEAALRSKD